MRRNLSEAAARFLCMEDLDTGFCGIRTEEAKVRLRWAKSLSKLSFR